MLARGAPDFFFLKKKWGRGFVSCFFFPVRFPEALLMPTPSISSPNGPESPTLMALMTLTVVDDEERAQTQARLDDDVMTRLLPHMHASSSVASTASVPFQSDFQCGAFALTVATIYGTTAKTALSCAVGLLTLPSVLPPPPSPSLWSQPARVQQGIDCCFPRLRGSGKWRSGLWYAYEHNPAVTGSQPACRTAIACQAADAGGWSWKIIDA